MKTFGFTKIKKSIGSTRQGIVESYTTSFISKYHQLENKAWWRKTEDTIHQKHYVSEERLTRLLNMKGVVR